MLGGLEHRREEISLLEKKDQQIRRLQAELEAERRRADNALRMLQNYQSIQAQIETTPPQTDLSGQLQAALERNVDSSPIQAYLETGIRKLKERL